MRKIIGNFLATIALLAIIAFILTIVFYFSGTWVGMIGKPLKLFIFSSGPIIFFLLLVFAFIVHPAIERFKQRL